MDFSQIYILISIIVLLVIAILVFFAKKQGKERRFTSLAGLGLAFVLAGVVFGDSWIIGYSLIGAGVLLAGVDVFIKLRKGK